LPIQLKISEYCTGCLENYYLTKEKVDWVLCIGCKKKWVHETYKTYGMKCNVCGRMEKRAKVLREGKSGKIKKSLMVGFFSFLPFEQICAYSYSYGFDNKSVVQTQSESYT
jgi:PHP family Zn ribbon phosphoesterase